MAFRARKLAGSSRGTQTLGEAFTASIPFRPVAPQSGEAYLDSLLLSFKGDAAAAVTTSAFLALVSALRFVAGVDRILLNGRDAFALSNAFYDAVPYFWEAAAAADDCKVGGIRIPMWTALKTGETYGFDITRVAVANISGEVLTLTALFREKPPGGGRIDARQIPDTLPAVTGLSTRVTKMPKIGILRGLLVFSTTVPTRTADLASVQRLIIGTDKQELIEAQWPDLASAMALHYDDSTGAKLKTVLDNYGWLDLSSEPIDLVANDIQIVVDVGVANDPVRYVPVIEVAQ